ncbi:MAG: hypothetical protein IPG52_12990 [Rhodocyclaceae bacterium]|nr:hypothetical protein [Rhodocyclaceae bacterium]
MIGLPRQAGILKGMRWLAWRRLRSAVRARMAAQAAGEPEATVDFLCNVCGRDNHQVPLIQVQNREFQSCRHCRSSLRMRSLIYRLSKELFGGVTLPEFPVSKEIVGIGMSDWEGYARSLEQCFAYTNTFYHQPPHLDITDVSEEMAGRADFLLSSDVFEHIPGFALGVRLQECQTPVARQGLLPVHRSVCQDRWAPGNTFPRLHDFRIITTAGKRFLYNRTVEGDERSLTIWCFMVAMAQPWKCACFQRRICCNGLPPPGSVRLRFASTMFLNTAFFGRWIGPCRLWHGRSCGVVVDQSHGNRWVAKR